jgi:hypothetical protein
LFCETVTDTGLSLSRLQNGPEDLESAGQPDSRCGERVGITRAQLGNVIHAIKKNARLRPSDDVIVWDDGSVSDASDEVIGNIYDEI